MVARISYRRTIHIKYLHQASVRNRVGHSWKQKLSVDFLAGIKNPVVWCWKTSTTFCWKLCRKKQSFNPLSPPPHPVFKVNLIVLEGAKQEHDERMTQCFFWECKPHLPVHGWWAQSILKELLSTDYHQRSKLTVTYCHYQTKHIRATKHLNIKT